MTSVHAEILRANYGAKRNLFALDELLGTDVPDPFGKGESAYEDLYRLFWNGLDKIYRTICKTDA